MAVLLRLKEPPYLSSKQNRKDRLYMIIFRRLLIVIVMIFLPLSILGWGGLKTIKHEYIDKFGITMGENNVYRKGNEVFVEEFYYTQGISGFNSIDYSLDISNFNEYLYYVCQNKDLPYVYVTIILKSSEDKYGNKYPGKKITIGKIDTKESKRYKDFTHWVQEYDFLKMFYKDKAEYDRKLENKRNSNGIGFMLIEAYYPRTIK